MSTKSVNTKSASEGKTLANVNLIVAEILQRRACASCGRGALLGGRDSNTAG